MDTKGDPEAPVRVGLDPQPMVDWFSPTELMRAGVKAVLAATFGNYADKREVQAALFPGPATLAWDGAEAKEIWFDYAADMGDGFNPTYAVAWLMAQPSLKVHVCGKDGAAASVTLPTGRFVVLGGDQVYPLATRDEYRKRMVDPYAMAYQTGQAGAPPAEPTRLFVVPGNHDWYDGLTSFIRLFCQGRSLGPLQTCQQRSYFAVRLPHDWWIWGVDVQLEADLDEPQKKFFTEILDTMKKASEGRTPRVILCTGQPAWVHCGNGPARWDGMRPAPTNFLTLSYLERLIRENGARVAVAMSGDLHHYAHYAPDDPADSHRITAGGGGAYFYPTHHLPESLDAPRPKPGAAWFRKKTAEKTSEAYTRANVYPSPEKSRDLGKWVLKLPINNWKFALFLSTLYLLFTWILQSASKAANSPFEFMKDGATGALAAAVTDPNVSLMGVLSVLGLGQIGDAARAYWHVMRHSPSSVSIALLVVLALWKYRAADRAAGQAWGGLHGVLHVLLSLGLIWIFSVVNLNPGWLELNIDGPIQVVLFSLEMFIAGGLAGGTLFALYLLLSARLTGVHMNDAYSSQSIQDFKNFVRFHVRPDGGLEIFPIAVPVVPRDDGWKVKDGTGLAPAADIRAELIGDGPIRID